MRVSLLLFALFAFCSSVQSLQLDETVAPAVYVSQYLPNNYLAGQNATYVTGIDYKYPSYAGYLTVNTTYNSNMYFWFFPAQNGSWEDAPVLLWLQGGPGSSSMFGLFSENGPFTADVENITRLVPNPYTWCYNFSVIYIDNPVGAGWSFTDDNRGYATNEVDVGNNLYSALVQFFQLFPNLQDNDFYVTGESYGGKYVPACAYTIWERNQDSSNQYINLVGISVGDGMMDPITQTQGYADLLYNFGMFDEQQVTEGHLYEQNVEYYILRQEYSIAFKFFDEYLNDDFYPYPSFYMNATGLSNYYNFQNPTYPPNPYIEYLNLPSTRNAIHVGDNPYFDYNSTVEEYLVDDWMRSVRPYVETLLDNYKVLIYNGQNDIILASCLCENFLRTVEWSGQNEYLSTQKYIWKINPDDDQIAGYAREVNNFRQVVVRDAGHLVPEDQPARALDMITRYIYDISFNTP